MKNALRIF
uniref:Uncharacterized protein n=1 Tax=Rhizophora mucronata TaxID=61149 RepID=A0A2P2LNC7_RHIMU